LSTDELSRFSTVDHSDRDAVVVLDGQQIIAVGRLDRLAPGSSTAEVAFVVDDGWQRRGLGAMLLRRLVERAAQLGITRLEADTLATNTAMQAVFRHAGLPVSMRLEHGVVHVTIEVAPPG
jgi:RimJ/RimL family protein N-acetyltransferase